MKDELHHHMKNNNIFQKAKEDMLGCLINLKEHIVMQLNCKLQESMDLSFKTPNSSLLPDDVTVEYNKMKMCYEKLGCSSTIQFTPRLDLLTKTPTFESQSGIGRKRVQDPTGVTMLTPEIDKEFSTHKSNPTYRLQCPKAGLFQCSSTGLVFLMEGKGDVLYMMAQWDRSLLGSLTPAGPLFSIDCPEQSICQLHLPHCMCDDKDEHLSVAHVTDGGKIEIVKPLKTTATHVIVNITHLSLFGLVWNKFSFLPVRSQVLLFLRPQGNIPQKHILNVILLPKNVPLSEVEHQQKGSTFIQTSSNCTLSPRGTYGLCCENVANSIIKPKSGKFDYDYSPNFHPTFQVFLDCMSDTENIRLSLLDRGSNNQRVWECPTGADCELNQISGEAFVDEHMAALIQRVTVVLPLADDLFVEKMIHRESYQKMCSAPTSQEQMRLMFDAVQSGGRTVKSAFYKALKKHELRLVQDLAAASR